MFYLSFNENKKKMSQSTVIFPCGNKHIVSYNMGIAIFQRICIEVENTNIATTLSENLGKYTTLLLLYFPISFPSEGHCNATWSGLFLSKKWSVETCLWPAALPKQRLEPEQHAGAGLLGADSRYSRHLWDEVTLAVCGHVLLLLLLAHWRPLELLHKLPSLVDCPF